MRLIRGFFLIIHLIVLGLLLGTNLNAYIPPSIISVINLLSLGFPILLAIHLMLTLFWILSWKKRAFVFILATGLLYNPISRWINWNQPKGEADLKVVTLNVKGSSFGSENINNYLNDIDADITFIQEDGNHLILSEKTKRHELLGISSKYSISNITPIELPDNGVAKAMYADIDVDGRMIRVINLYLESFQIDKKMVRPSDNTEVNKRKARKLLGHLIPNFKKHEKQINTIEKVIEDSPYPVILAGDFNSVPNSYEYYTINKHLEDPFMTVGRGLGTTFHDFKFPIRIDYIFASKEIKPISIKVDRSQKVSDHKPVIATFKLP